MSAPLLLDTCACIFIVRDELSPGGGQVLLDRYSAGEFVLISPISAWEIGSLIRLGRLRSPLTAPEYFQRIVGHPSARLAEMPPEVLMASWFLPGNPPRDPADRIIAATARTYGYTVMTRDQSLLDYAQEGHLAAVSC